MASKSCRIELERSDSSAGAIAAASTHRLASVAGSGFTSTAVHATSVAACKLGTSPEPRVGPSHQSLLFSTTR